MTVAGLAEGGSCRTTCPPPWLKLLALHTDAQVDRCQGGRPQGLKNCVRESESSERAERERSQSVPSAHVLRGCSGVLCKNQQRQPSSSRNPMLVYQLTLADGNIVAMLVHWLNKLQTSQTSLIQLGQVKNQQLTHLETNLILQRAPTLFSSFYFIPSIFSHPPAFACGKSWNAVVCLKRVKPTPEADAVTLQEKPTGSHLMHTACLIASPTHLKQIFETKALVFKLCNILDAT
ncbi:hypothetical protein IRJ41_007300 [Triplophysa rosa]|uniref:Uncharacterized protein n=1 Tax=Triplophysa rosa TaxID=992332 RepID=A0A9W7TJR2_TRIRA|nr:hypothetical protein IRJ41_007300 [Triplophysa rosa]